MTGPQCDELSTMISEVGEQIKIQNSILYDIVKALDNIATVIENLDQGVRRG